MDERMMQFRVGVMVFATLIIAAILLVMFGELPKLIHKEYTIDITFDSAPGVKKETPVRKSGILIGRVTRVEFTADAEGRPDASVRVTAAVQGDKRLYENDVCYVQSSLLGDSALEFVRVDKPNIPNAPLADGASIRGYVQVEPAELMRDLQKDLGDTIGSVTDAAGNLSTASHKLGDTLDMVNKILKENQEGLRTAVDQANVTMVSVQKVADATNELVGDEQFQKEVRDAIRQMPPLIEDVRETVASLRTTVGKVDVNLDNVQQLTAKLGSEEMLQRVDRSAQNLEYLTGQLAKFSRSLNNPDGSLGKLINDPELYCHVSRAVANIDELTRQLRPIIDDARVFSDKIARHPEMLGVRGAMERNAGIK
jgi:phospholipid/cholesterol/gamma-HCH transport system substrate-binding protein